MENEKEIIKNLEEAVNNKISSMGLVKSEELDSLQKSIEELRNNSYDDAELKSAISNIEKSVNSLTEATIQEKEDTLSEALKSNMEDIKGLAQKTSNKDVVLKANTVRASISNNTESMRLLDIARLGHRRLSMYDIFPKIQVRTDNDNGTITYTDWDEATTVRAAAMIAEGGTFPESTATWVENFIKLQKVGDTLPVTEEFYEDEARFAGELELFLQTNVELVVDDQICNGDGTGTNLRGLITSSLPFSATGLSSVPNATFYDLLAIAPEMNINHNSKYMFDVVLMNKKEINKMRLAKDVNNNYIIPPFVSQDGREVDGMLVIESNVVPDNECILGDRRYAKLYEKGGVMISRGTVNDQFTQDLETIKIRKRLAFLVRQAEQRAFIHIGDISAAITAITA